MELVLLNSFKVITFEDHFSIKRCVLAAVLWMLIPEMGDNLCVLHVKLLGILIFLLYLWKNGGLLLSELKWFLSAWDQCFGGSAAGKHLRPISLQVLVFTTAISQSNMGSFRSKSVTSRSPVDNLCAFVLWMVCWETCGFSHGGGSCCKTNGCTVSNTSRRGKICTSWSE